MSQENGVVGDYYEIGGALAENLLKEVLKVLPEAEDDESFTFYEYQNAGRFEEAFTAAAGYMWKQKKRLPDDILDKWDSFIYDPGDDYDVYDRPLKTARACLEAQRALPK